jgi:hypothetical protein
VRTPEQEARRDALHEAALLMDQMWDEQVKGRSKENYLYPGLHYAYKHAATRLRKMADPPETRRVKRDRKTDS